ncbi:MAG: hypothetical protein RL430_1555 [Actinomycetota bacterium]|jgi:hypothetical protein
MGHTDRKARKKAGEKFTKAQKVPTTPYLDRAQREEKRQKDLARQRRAEKMHERFARALSGIGRRR